MSKLILNPLIILIVWFTIIFSSSATNLTQPIADADANFTKTIDRVVRFIRYNRECNEALVSTLKSLNMSQTYVAHYLNNNTYTIDLYALLTPYTNLVELQNYFRVNNFSTIVKEQMEAKINETKVFFQNLARFQVLRDGLRAKLAQRNLTHCIVVDIVLNLTCVRRDFDMFTFVNNFINRWIQTVNSCVNNTMDQIKDHLSSVHPSKNSSHLNNSNNNSMIINSSMRPIVYQSSSQIINQSEIKIDEKHIDDQIEEWRSLIAKLSSNTTIESYVKAKPRTKVKTLQEVADYLAKCPYVCNDLEKTWLVFVWIAENIAYDSRSYMSGKYESISDAQSVLTSGLSVCQGYSELFADLCKRLGVECVSMSGYSKAFGYRIGQKLNKKDHRWNAFRSKEDRKWRYVDSTWAAGHTTWDFKFVKEFDPYYFATPPYVFNERHFSDEFYLESTHKSLEEFEKAPANELYFHMCGLKCLNYHTSEIRVATNPLIIKYESKQKIQFAAELLYKNGGSHVENAILWQTNYSSTPYFKYNLNVALPKPNETFILNLYAKANKEDESCKHISEFHLIRTETDRNDAIKFAQLYGTNVEYNIHSPVEFNLKQNQLYEFHYFIKDALKVALLDAKHSLVHFEKPKSEGKFANSSWVMLKSFATLGRLTLLAQFDEKSSYVGICFYEILN